MQNISDLKDAINTKTIDLVLLTIVTAGIYPLMWMFKNQGIINKITNKEFSGDKFIIWIAVCAGLSMTLQFTGEDALDVISQLLSLASSILFIVWAFKAKSALQEYALNTHKIDFRMKVFYTLIFNVYYINYCFNDLPESKRKQDILKGNTEG